MSEIPYPFAVHLLSLSTNPSRCSSFWIERSILFRYAQNGKASLGIMSPIPKEAIQFHQVITKVILRDVTLKIAAKTSHLPGLTHFTKAIVM